MEEVIITVILVHWPKNKSLEMFTLFSPKNIKILLHDLLLLHGLIVLSLVTYAVQLIMEQIK